jgi:hypothetical protein
MLIYHPFSKALLFQGPRFPKGDNKDDSHIFMRFLRTHLPEDPKVIILIPLFSKEGAGEIF